MYTAPEELRSWRHRYLKVRRKSDFFLKKNKYLVECELTNIEEGYNWKIIIWGNIIIETVKAGIIKEC